MRFEKETLFKELVKKHGLNLFLGAGFSVYANNQEGESLPLGKDINEKLIALFALDKDRKYSLSKTCQRIKKDNEEMLEKILKETYTVSTFDKEYIELTRLPIKNIITTNIDNLLEKIYDDSKASVNLSDAAVYGSFEKDKVVNLYKLHGSVTYPFGAKMSFTEKELTDLINTITSHNLLKR